MRFSKKFLKKGCFFGHLVLFTLKNNHFWDLFLKCPKNEINMNIFQFKLNWVLLTNLVFVDILSISILGTKKKKHYNELETGIFNRGDVT